MKTASPKINNLQPDSGALLAEITILTNEGAAAAEPAPTENAGLTAPAGAPAAQNPTPKALVRKKRKNAGPEHLQEAEMERLFKVLASPAGSSRNRAIFRLAYHAGLRASEVGMLDLRDYSPRTDRIFIHRLKGSNSGEHHLCREEAKALKAWLKVRGAAPGSIFPSKKGGPISRQMLDVLMKFYGGLAGLPKRLQHFHVLKHTCCTHLLNRGFNVEQVQDWVGHSNIQNTLVYAKITNSRRSEMAKTLRDTWR